MRKRQQVGRGLRLPVMENGERCHVDDVNVLTVIAKESFATFAGDAPEGDRGGDRRLVHRTGSSTCAKKKTSCSSRRRCSSDPTSQSCGSASRRKTTYQLEFSTDDVVAEAVERINAMRAARAGQVPRLEGRRRDRGRRARRRREPQDRGEVVAESARKIPDVVGELCRRLPLSRATIVRILKECDHLDQVKVNPAVFIDQVAEAINQALYDQVADGIVYSPDRRDRWSAELIRERAPGRDGRAACRRRCRRASPTRSCATRRSRSGSPSSSTARPTSRCSSSCPSGSRSRRRSATTTPTGRSCARSREGRLPLPRARDQGHADIEKLQLESEGWKIKFGEAHFDALGVDYAFGEKPELLIVPSRGEGDPVPDRPRSWAPDDSRRRPLDS